MTSAATLPAHPTVPVRARAWHGVVAGLFGLGVAEALAALVSASGSPLAAVSSTVLDLLPAPIVNAGKDLLGFFDKPALVIVVAVIALAVAAGAGRLAGRSGILLLAAPFLLALVCVLLRPGVGPLSVVPVLVGAAAALVTLTRLRVADEAVADANGVPRRRFLTAGVALAVLGVIGAAWGYTRNAGASVVAQARKTFRVPDPAVTLPPIDPATELGVPGLAPYLTPNDGFYRIDTAFQIPQLDPETWALRIHGMVQREVNITMADLLSRPLIQTAATLTCVSNPVGGDLIGNAIWTGVPIRDLLAEAGPHAGADMVLQRSADGWTCGTPLSALTDPSIEAILAVTMNGEPLPPVHGFPVRAVVPGLYGYVSATKWITEMKVTTFADDQGYWTPLGWDAEGPIKIGCRIDTPSAADPGTVRVAGVAWQQHTGISAVEVRVGDGPWREATLGAVINDDTWVQWMIDLDLEAGTHQVQARATNSQGETQTADLAQPAPNGATGYPSRDIRVGG